jgi:hypothetical protein
LLPFSVHEVQIAVRIEAVVVPGVMPEIAERLHGGLEIAPVAVEHHAGLPRTDHDLADLADRNLVVVVIKHAGVTIPIAPTPTSNVASVSRAP